MPGKKYNYKHRKIYEDCYGPIPTDKDGRTYDIHHIDGNNANNHPANLYACSQQEHYDIHHKQKDWMACHRIAQRMFLPQEEISKLISLAKRKEAEEGKLAFQIPGFSKTVQLDRVRRGVHPFQNIENSRKWNSYKARKRVEDGTSHCVIRTKCPYCGTIGAEMIMKRWHFDNCKERI